MRDIPVGLSDVREVGSVVVSVQHHQQFGGWEGHAHLTDRILPRLCLLYFGQTANKQGGSIGLLC